jgi:hypothetical protein
MVGLGEVAALTADQAKPVADAVVWLEDSVHQNPKQQRWSPLAPGLGATAGHFGPELAFGRRIRRAWPNRPIAIIKVAEGGTNLHTDWKADSGRLYRLFLNTVRDRLAGLKDKWRPTVAGMAWMQGESDSTPAHADAYEQNLRDFIQSVRADLKLPNLPTTIGLIAPIALWSEHETIRSAQRKVAGDRPATTVVDTAGFSRHSDDPAHYNSKGQLRLGDAFAEALLSLQE